MQGHQMYYINLRKQINQFFDKYIEATYIHHDFCGFENALPTFFFVNVQKWF